MSVLNKHRIKRYRKDILNDIQEDVIEELEKLKVLSTLDMEQLNNMDDFNKKMEKFLDIIVKKTPPEVELFVRYLEVWYIWLYNLIVNPNKNVPLHDDLIRGGVPPLPHRNITRTLLVDRVREKLIDLKRDQYLVLHGMIGCGKTSLATEAVNNDEVHELCKGRIYWIPVGSEGEKNLPSLQECLNAILPEPESNLTDDVDVALLRLRTRFSDWEEGRDALIILDDVHSEKVVKYLSVGTKLLITTENENIITRGRKSVTFFEKVPDGFEEEETLALFASGIGIKAKELPPQARRIHKFSKGHPMSVSLISGQLEDHKEQMLTKGTSRWDYYVKLFSDKTLKRSLDLYGTYNAIKHSIESISEKGKEYFKHFVLFVEDVNIKSEVLSIIWSMDKHEVENLMMEYVRKSLVVRKWNTVFSSYIYGIHYLILQYLLENLSKDYVESLHRNLIESYMKVCNGDLSKLKEEDNYIFFYIGRHLKYAKMYNLFPVLYFNLEFIEIKLKKAGPADVILDFKHYGNLIIGDKVEVDNTAKYNSFLHFVELYGSWVHKGMDIVQLALQENSNTYVYTCATELACRRNLIVPYVLFPLGPHDKKRIVPQMVTVKKDISCVCCIDSSYFVLVGMYNGNIELWDLKSKITKRNFNEHTGCILKLKLNSNSDKFLSTSTDGTVRVWDLVQDIVSDRTPSPRERQESYSEFWPSSVENVGEKSFRIISHSGPVLWASFAQSSTSNIMASVSHPSLLTVWDGSSIKWNLEENGAKSCELCSGDLYVVVGGSEQVSIYDIDTAYLLHHLNWKIQFLYVVPENLGGGLLMVSEDRVDVWGISDDRPTIIPSEIRHDETYTCCALSGHIALGTNMNNVIVCHRHTGKTLKRLSESRADSKVVDVGLTEGALVTAYNDKTMFLWPLDDLVLPLPHICWPLESSVPFISRVTLDNSIQICRGRKIVKSIPVDQEILGLTLSPDRKLIAYTNSQSKIIHIVRVDNNEVIKCDMNINFPIKFYLFTHNEKPVIAALGEKSQVHVWFQATDKVILLGKESVRSTFITMTSKDEPTLITVSRPFGVHLWDLNTGSIIRRLSIHKPQKFSISFDKNIMVLSEGSIIQIINSNEHLSTESFTQMAPVIDCSLSPNGKIVAFALKNNKMVIYNIDSRKRNEYLFNRKANVDLIMAVSNSGILCVATSEPLVAVYTDLGMSYVVLHASSIVASPSHPNMFAVIDNSGELHVLHVYKNNSDLLCRDMMC
uniref:Putative apoptotic protease-activating factor 1-like protein n=1 Tax=Panstrongylus lignarius TaxID=156445 RepID=A0A224X5F0_9HEMI